MYKKVVYNGDLIKENEIIAEIFSQEYLSANVAQIGKMAVGPGEAIQVIKDGQPEEKMTKGGVAFGTVSTGCFKKKTTGIDLEHNNYEIIWANITAKTYKVNVPFYTSDFALVSVQAQIDAHISENDLVNLISMDKISAEIAEPEGMNGYINVVSLTTVKDFIEVKIYSKICNLVGSISSTDLMSRNYKNEIRNLIHEMQPEWVKMGFVVEKMDIVVEPTIYELSNIEKKKLEDEEIGNVARYDAEVREYERNKAMRERKLNDDVAFKLKELELKREMSSYNVDSGIEEDIKDRAHKRRIELLHAEAEAAQANKGYLEGYMAGYKDGQRDMEGFLALVANTGDVEKKRKGLFAKKDKEEEEK